MFFHSGLCASGSQFGGISLAPLSQILFDRLGYANTFRTFSGLLLIVTISSLAYKPELVENKTLNSGPKKSPREMLVVWKNKTYVVWALSTTMVTLGYNIPRYTLVSNNIIWLSLYIFRSRLFSGHGIKGFFLPIFLSFFTIFT